MAGRVQRGERILSAVAYHEAGHAVMAFHLGRAIRHVTIIPTPEKLGCVLMRDPPKSLRPDADLNPRAARWLENEIMVCLAGPAAESKHTGRKNYRGAERDYSSAITLASYLHGRGEVAEKYIAFMDARTRARVASPAFWVQAEALARRLIDRRRLTAREAKAVCFDAIQDEIRARAEVRKG